MTDQKTLETVIIGLGWVAIIWPIIVSLVMCAIWSRKKESKKIVTGQQK